MWGFSKKLPTIPGKYTFKATYNGTSCSTTFNITTQSGSAYQESLSLFKIYPNPYKGNFIIESGVSNTGIITIYNTIGEIVFQSEILTPKSEISFDQKSGIYFYEIKNKNQSISKGKLIIE